LEHVNKLLSDMQWDNCICFIHTYYTYHVNIVIIVSIWTMF